MKSFLSDSESVLILPYHTSVPNIFYCHVLFYVIEQSSAREETSKTISQGDRNFEK